MTPFEKDASVGVITNGKERRHFPWFLKTQTRADGGYPFGVFANKGGRAFSYNQKLKSTSKRKDASVGVITNGKERRFFPSFMKTQTRADGGYPFGVFVNKRGRGFSYNQKLKNSSNTKDSILFLPKHASIPYSLARILHGIHFQS